MHLQPKMELDMLVFVYANQIIQLFYPVKKQNKNWFKKIDIQKQIFDIYYIEKSSNMTKKNFFLQSNASRTHF